MELGTLFSNPETLPLYFVYPTILTRLIVRRVTSTLFPYPYRTDSILAKQEELLDINPEERVDRLKRANPRRVPDEDPKDRIPPGQYLTEKFPVLTKGPTPNLHLDRWRFRLFGNVANDVELTYSEFLSLPQITITTDFHCVTRWSMLDSTWMGVHISEVLK